MSVVINSDENRLAGDYVKTCYGEIYWVDSANTIDRGYETMVFKAEPTSNGEYRVYFDELYQEVHSDYESMLIRHRYIISNLEEILNEDCKIFKSLEDYKKRLLEIDKENKAIRKELANYKRALEYACASLTYCAPEMYGDVVEYYLQEARKEE